MKTDKNSQYTKSGTDSQPEQAVPDNNQDSTMPVIPPTEAEEFAPLIFAYTRKEALADGVQLEITKQAKEAGFHVPVFMTDTVFNEYVKVPDGVEGQDVEGRLREILLMLHCAVLRVPMGIHEVRFHCYVRNSMTEPECTVVLLAICSAMDIDDPAPAITIMMPEEN